MWEMVSLKRHALLSIDTLECLVFFKGIVIIVETSRGYLEKAIFLMKSELLRVRFTLNQQNDLKKAKVLFRNKI